MCQSYYFSYSISRATTIKLMIAYFVTQNKRHYFKASIILNLFPSKMYYKYASYIHLKSANFVLYGAFFMLCC